MKRLLSELRPALIATLVLAAVTCGAYPLLVTAVAQTLFHEKALGSLVRAPGGGFIGSALLGQNFRAEHYFHPRPSAAGNGYDASSSGGSNLGPTSQKLHDQLAERLSAYRRVNGLAAETPVPADAVTASGSGLDPHISPENAERQLPRVAKARHLRETTIRALISANTDRRDLGFLGEPGVNVLKLNLCLDTLH